MKAIHNMDSKVDFVCCDMPSATPLTLHIFAAIAQNEWEMISTRTKDALQALKARCKKLGTPSNLPANAAQLAGLASSERAKNNINNIQSAALSHSLRQQGHKLIYIAESLNSKGFKTSRGYLHNANTVSILLKKF